MASRGQPNKDLLFPGHGSSSPRKFCTLGTLVDKFVGILPEINLPETSARKVLATLAAFEVELARRQGGRHERRRAGPIRRFGLDTVTQAFLAPLAPKFFEELFLIQRLMAVHQFEQGIIKILGRGLARVVRGS